MGGYYGAAVRPAKVTIIRRATLRSRLIMVESQTTQALADVKLAASGLEQLLSGSRKREADAAELRKMHELRTLVMYATQDVALRRRLCGAPSQ